MDPATATIIASAIAASAKAGSDYFAGNKEKKAGARRAKETRRETESNMFSEALQRSAELEAQKLAGRKKIGKRKAQSSQETADIVRGAFR